MFKNWHQPGNILQQTTRYQGPVFSVDQCHIKTPDGLLVERDLVHCSATVTILAMTADQEVVLTSEYRVGVNADSVSLPAGLVNPGETVLQAAKREFREETGFIAQSAKVMTTVTASEGFMDQTAALVFIEFDQSIRKTQHFDTDEFVNVNLVDYTKLRQWLADGKINTAQAMAAVGYYELFLKEQPED